MHLLHVLKLLKEPISEPTTERELYLACGFTPLHLKTFLAAHLRLCLPKGRWGFGRWVDGAWPTFLTLWSQQADKVSA